MNLDDHIKDLDTIVSEYREWFMQILRCISYPGYFPKGQAVTQPVSFALWAKKAQDSSFKKASLERLTALHSDMTLLVSELVQSAQESKRPPGHEDYSSLLTFYEEFTHNIQRFQNECVGETSGSDTLTGLRSEAFLKHDLQRELNRLERRGMSFCVAIIRINGFDEFRLSADSKIADEALKVVADIIKDSIRSFDDAYCMADDNFLICLKQTPIDGGFRAVERIRRALEQKEQSFNINGRTEKLSLSSFVAEPVPEDKVDDLLENLKLNLGQYKPDDGAVLEYVEMSPLERLIRKKQE